MSAALAPDVPDALDRRPYEDELQPVPQPTRAQRIMSLVSPTLILGGLLAHTILEGLAIGLQVGAPPGSNHLRCNFAV